MLRKFGLGLTGVVLLVILMIAIATFNVGSVNASPAATKDYSKLKFITKYVPGYGNVTAREDMFVGSGDNITIVANKDYAEHGLITPHCEKYP